MRVILQVVVTSALLLIGCTEAGSKTSDAKVVVPLLKECDAHVKTVLGRIPASMEVSHSITYVDEVLPSHPNVVGYVEMRSPRGDKNRLIAIANSFRTQCYPESRSEIDVKASDAGRKLLDALELFRIAGAENRYIVDAGDRLLIYVSQGAISRDVKSQPKK